MANLDIPTQEPTQAEAFRVPKKTPEEHGAQVGRIVSKLLERARAVPYEYRKDGAEGISVHSANVYGSTGSAANNLRAGYLAHKTSGTPDLVDITQWRQQNETHRDNPDRTAYLQDTPGPVTGAYTIDRFKETQPPEYSGATTFVDVNSPGGETVLRPGVNSIGDLDRAIDSTAQALAFARQKLQEAEVRQKTATEQ